MQTAPMGPMGLTNLGLHYLSIEKYDWFAWAGTLWHVHIRAKKGAPVAHWVKRWSTDLAD